MPKDLRRSGRRHVRKAVILLIEAEGDKRAHGAQTVDLSECGLRVRADISLNPGQVLELVPPEGSDYAVRCLVVWTGEVGSDKEGEAGLDFLGPLQAPGLIASPD
jgi:PilZ domain-containing protein